MAENLQPAEQPQPVANTPPAPNQQPKQTPCRVRRASRDPSAVRAG
jgi:hypothetical protein